MLSRRRIFAVASAHLLNPPEGHGCTVVRTGVGTYTLDLPAPGLADDSVALLMWPEDPGSAVAVSVMASRVGQASFTFRVLRGGAPTEDHAHVSICQVDDDGDGNGPLGH